MTLTYTIFEGVLYLVEDDDVLEFDLADEKREDKKIVLGGSYPR